VHVDEFSQESIIPAEGTRRASAFFGASSTSEPYVDSGLKTIVAPPCFLCEAIEVDGGVDGPQKQLCMMHFGRLIRHHTSRFRYREKDKTEDTLDMYKS
jgi:hypothetical protein